MPNTLHKDSYDSYWESKRAILIKDLSPNRKYKEKLIHISRTNLPFLQTNKNNFARWTQITYNHVNKNLQVLGSHRNRSHSWKFYSDVFAGVLQMTLINLTTFLPSKTPTTFRIKPTKPTQTKNQVD